MSTVNIIQTTMEFWSAFFVLICTVGVYHGRKNEPKRSRFLLVLLVLDSLLLISDGFALIYDGVNTPIGILATHVGNYMVFVIPPLMVPIITMYMIVLVRYNGQIPRYTFLGAITAVAVLDILVISGSQITDFLYVFDANNVYHRSRGYIVVSLLGLVMVAMLLIGTIYHRKHMSKYEFWTLMGYEFLPLISNIIQLLHYGLSLNNIAITIALTLVYLNHQLEKSNRLARQQRLIAEHQIALAEKDAALARQQTILSISQMQPHFIFNSLGSIEQLCRMDPEKAADATHHFAVYLRRNLNSMSSTDLSPFETELEHVRTYVWLEKMRFGDELDYREELGVKEFRLPVLTIQPLVENAIKHGMMSKEGLLHVTLRTEEKDGQVVISIIDDGSGFDTSHPTDNRTHVGLTNVRNRIRDLMNGALTIDSTPGAGSTVTITLPKN